MADFATAMQSPTSAPASTTTSSYGEPSARSVDPAPGLVKSNSTASAGGVSVTSHISVPVTGTLPYGSLRVHTASDPPTDQVAPHPPPKCLDTGDIFLVLDMPDRSTLGQDAMAVTAGDAKLLGVRDIPPGPHLLWVSEPGAISRCGYWYLTKEDDTVVRVKQWDRYNEVLGEAASRFELHDKKGSIESIYPKLIPHDYAGTGTCPPPPPPKDPPTRGSVGEPAAIWRQLTWAISEDVLNSIAGTAHGGEWLVDTSDTAKGEIRFPASSGLLRTVVGAELSFLFPQDPADPHLLGLSSNEEPRHDTSTRILAVVDNPSSMATDADLVGELQFTFLTGLHLGNPACIEQWWHLVLRILLRAYALVVSRPTLCRALLQTLHTQMVYNDVYIAPQADGPTMDGSGGAAGILEVLPQGRSRLREALTVYKRRLNEALLSLGSQITEEQGAVGLAFADLEAWFWRHGWDLRSDYVHEQGVDGFADESDDDYVPVVVDLDENGREVGLVSWGAN